MPKETIDEKVVFDDADHPPRANTPTYNKTRRELMKSFGGGCFICDGPIDMNHPGVASPTGLQDHHGGGLYATIGDAPVLVGMGLLALEWSEGWGSDPKVVAGLVKNANRVRSRLGTDTYDTDITDQASVMDYTDSIYNANIKLCAVHHIGHPDQEAKDARGYQGVGIHYVPMPVFLYQLTCDWKHWDMFAGTTGTIAVAPDPTNPGGAQVLHVHPSHPDKKIVAAANRGENITLPAGHPHAIAAHKTDKYRKMKAFTSTSGTEQLSSPKTTSKAGSTPKKSTSATRRRTTAGSADKATSSSATSSTARKTTSTAKPRKKATTGTAAATKPTSTRKSTTARTASGKSSTARTSTTARSTTTKPASARKTTSTRTATAKPTTARKSTRSSTAASTTRKTTARTSTTSRTRTPALTAGKR